MSDRETLRLDFLKAAGLADAVRAPCPVTPRRGGMSG